jgi:uncharacterized protein YlxW (UPF0749 family)
VGTPLVVLACGALFVVSALNSDGTDLRPGRYNDLSQLAASEANRYQRLEDQVHSLTTEVNDLTAQVSDTSVRELRRRAATIRGEAGFSKVTGEGLTITMSDAPDSLIQQASGDDASRMVVHQQDVQAVVNALWHGGAEAVTIAGQRIISTTGIKCTGSTITLQGVPYPQPFVIEAVGDISTLMSTLDEDSYVSLYRAQAADPTIAIGWDLSSSYDITAPAYAGLRDLNYAKPLTTSG